MLTNYGINGKPRPVVLAYLGKANDLVKRLQGLTQGVRLKSYSHGCVAAMLHIADQLEVCTIINQYAKSVGILDLHECRPKLSGVGVYT